MLMTRSRATTLLILPFALGSLLGGCATDAVGIEECREIEFARCEASVPCGVIEADEVEECKNVYRDQCLHGISGPEEPTADRQKTCVDMIVEAGERASELAGELEQEPERETDELSPTEVELNVVCRIVSEPWERNECDYLNEASGAGGADGDGEDE